MAYRTLILLVSVLVWSVSCAADASELATIKNFMPEYPRSDRVNFKEDEEVLTHQIMLGTLKRDKGVVRPEASRFVVGRRVSITWFVPNETRTQLVTQFFRDKLVPLGQMLFECKSYVCGSSNYWANNVFEEEVLYGPEEDQHYFVVRIDRPDGTYYVAVYIALRGTRKLYAHADIVIVEPDKPEISADKIIEALKSEGEFGIDPSDENKALGFVIEAMRAEPTFRIAVVRHSKRLEGESVPEAIARTEKDARAYADRLISKGVDQTRVQAYGIGPLAPLHGETVDRIELVLISND